LLAVVGLTALVLQTAAIGSATLAGAKPELMVLSTIALAMSEGAEFGATAGFVLGMLGDLMTGLPRGVSALVFTGVGYAVGRARAQMTTPTATVPIVMSFAGTAAGLLVSGAIELALGRHVGGGTVVQDALLSGAYNALLTPFAVPLIRILAGRLRPAGAQP
jgi:rod shape-determining protein MreD